MLRPALFVLLLTFGSALAQTQPVPQVHAGPTARFLAATESASLRLGSRVVLAEGSITKQFVACVDALPIDLYYPVVVRFLERELSPEERAEADAFFASELGSKFLNSVQAAASSGLPVDLSSLVANLSDADDLLPRNFLENSAGEKLLVKSLFRKGPARQEVAAANREMLKSCASTSR